MILRPLVSFISSIILGILISSASSSPVEIGMNYNWFGLNAAGLTDCVDHSASVFTGEGIVPLYNQSGKRELVSQQLRMMRSSGFDSLRILIGARENYRDNGSGPIPVKAGQFDSLYDQNIINFIGDIAKSGYAKIEVAFAFYDNLNPYCRIKEFGDCFVVGSQSSNWATMRRVIDDVNRSKGTLRVRFDLLNEGCPSQYLSSLTRKHVEDYLKNIILNYRLNYKTNDWVVSCADSAMGERVMYMGAIIHDLDLPIKIMELHTYVADEGQIEESLHAADLLLKGPGSELVIGESLYNNEAQVKIIERYIVMNPSTKLREVLQWPLISRKGGCQIDTAPPFRPGSSRGIGKQSP